MGWCSGTSVFDAVLEGLISKRAFKTLGADPNAIPMVSLEKVIRSLIRALENHDWDCQSDSYYAEQPLVKRVMYQIHPDWEDDSGDNFDDGYYGGYE